VEGDEIARVSSPDNVLDAVLIQGRTGATVATPSYGYIVRKGEWPRKNDRVLVADHFGFESFKWKDLNLLEIRYSEGRIFQFKNFWRLKNDGSPSDRAVEIRLQATIEGNSPEFKPAPQR